MLNNSGNKKTSTTAMNCGNTGPNLCCLKKQQKEIFKVPELN